MADPIIPAEGYTKDVLTYVRAHPEVLAQREQSDSKIDSGTTGHQAPSSTLQPASADAASGSGTTAATGTGSVVQESVEADAEAPRAAPIRLTIRGGPDQKVLLAVPPSKTVLSVIKHFLRKFNFDPAKAGQCRLYFDGEEIEHDTPLGQTEVEDEDTLDIKVPNA